MRGPDRGDLRAAASTCGWLAACRPSRPRIAAPAAVPAANHEALVELGEDDVGAAIDLGPRAHRRAEAGRCRRSALDGDRDRLVLPGRVIRIAHWPGAHGSILDPQRRQFTRAYADEGDLRCGLADGFDDDRFAVAPAPRQRDQRRMDEALPGCRAGVGVEHAVPTSRCEPIRAGRGLCRPA